MSAFLGPIHYVMYDRMKTVNKREKELALVVRNKWGEKGAAAVDRAGGKFGHTCQQRPLAEQINGNAIHSWLEEELNLVLTSESALVADIVSAFKDDGKKLVMEVFRGHGQSISLGLISKGEIKKDDIESVRNQLMIHLLERMPCDHVSETVEVTGDSFTVERDLLANTENWLAANAPTDLMIQANEAWIRGFIEACGSFSFERNRKTSDGNFIWVDTVKKG